MKTVETKRAPAALGPYSQAVVTGDFVYTSGQIPIDPQSGNIEAKDIRGQAKQAIHNIGEILSASGSSFENVIKTTCFLKDMGDCAAFNEVYAEYFTGKPARSCVEVSALPKGALVEIEAVAKLG